MSIFQQFPYIVIEGPIGCGKTTLAKKLHERFGVDYLSEKADENPFLPRFYQDMSRYALPTQLFFLFQRAKQIESLSQHDMFAKPTVADFFVVKDPLFAKLNLNEEEYALYHQIYQHLELKVAKPDLVIYLQSSLDALMQRIQRRNVSYEQDVSSDYIKRLAETYNHFFYHYQSTRVLIVNNEKLNIMENDTAFDLLIERIGEIKGQREFFNPNLDETT